MHNWAGTAYGLSELGRDASTGNILDVANQGRGIAPSTESITAGDGGGCPSHSPLYLLASEIVDIVTKGYEQ